jgi:hypothetical protein
VVAFDPLAAVAASPSTAGASTTGSAAAAAPPVASAARRARPIKTADTPSVVFAGRSPVRQETNPVSMLHYRRELVKL